MSLTGSATDTNLNVLRGKIVSVSPYSIDPSLKTEGAAADAKATGDAIDAVENHSNSHINSVSNPHKVTKAQIGLGDVDNTADIEKPVSRPQAEAIADAKKAGTDAKAALDLALSERNEFTDEEKEKLAGIEDGANKFVLEDGAVSNAKIADGAVSTSKLADAAVTRAKLANDALYSPIKSVDTSKTPNYEITVADIGLTLREHSGASPGCVFVFNDANCTDIPVGVEIAFINWASQSRTELHFAGVHVVMAGEKYINNSDKTYKLRIAEQYGMIAVKKIIGDSNGVTVLVTGNVEVVE